jgi:hypothetical protein
MGDYAKALEYLNQALSIRETLFGSEDPSIIKVKDKISETQTKLKEQEESQPKE